MSWSTTMGVSHVAWQECALLGHREIDVEHVLLATMQDDAVAGLLLGHGVSREGTRTAIDAAVADEVSALGLELDAVGSGQRRSVDDLHHDAVGDLGMSGRAQRLIHEGTGPARILVAALEDESGTARRLVRAQGADPDAVLEDARRLAARAPRGPDADRADTSGLRGLEALGRDPGRSVRRSQLLAAPVEQVWALCSTAEGIRQWLDSDPQAEVDIVSPDELIERPRTDSVLAGAPGARLLSLTRRRVALHEDGAGGGVVLWDGEVQARLAGREESLPGRWNHLTVRAQGADATRIEVVSGGVLRGRPRWLRDLVNRFALRVSTRNAVYRLGVLVEGPNTSG